MAHARGLKIPKLNLSCQNTYTGKTAYIIGGGPTNNDDMGGGKTRLQQMDDIQDKAVIKVLTGSSHRLLDQKKLENDADISVYNMPGAGSADSIDRAHEGVQYWLASQCDPAMFEKLGNAADICLWEPYVPEADYDGINDLVVGAGSTAPTAAVALLLAQGCTSFEFFGVDGGNFDFAPNEYAAYDMDDILARPDLQEELQNNLLIRLSDGRAMTVAANFWNQASEMKNLMDASPDCKFVFHGNSLNHLLFNQGLTAEVTYDPRNERLALSSSVPKI